jgi:soluble lytic murein transglycosylase-like protein
MTHKLSQFLLVSLLLLSLCSFESPPGKFKWDKYLHEQVVAVNGDASSYAYRRAQVWAESRDNPLATSDFGGWRKLKMDTSKAVKDGLGAAGLSQFIWPTAERYGAKSISTKAARDTIIANDIYNPYWSLKAMCSYMKTIRVMLMSRANALARRKFQTDQRFAERCTLAGYNAGEGRIMGLLKKHSSWRKVRTNLPLETRIYAEKIVK